MDYPIKSGNDREWKFGILLYGIPTPSSTIGTSLNHHHMKNDNVIARLDRAIQFSCVLDGDLPRNIRS